MKSLSMLQDYFTSKVFGLSKVYIFLGIFLIILVWWDLLHFMNINTPFWDISLLLLRAVKDVNIFSFLKGPGYIFKWDSLFILYRNFIRWAFLEAVVLHAIRRACL